MNDEQKARALGEVAEQAAPDALDLWPRIQRRATSSAARGPNRGRTRIAIGVAAALLIALIAALSPWSSRPQPVSAETILAKAQAASKVAQGTRPYHLQSVGRLSVKGGQTVEEELWYGSGRARLVSTMKGADGKTSSTVVVVYDGSQTIMAATMGGQTKVEKLEGTNAKFGSEGLGERSSLSDFLAQYDNAKACMTARVDGEAVVAGRPAYAVVVEPNQSGCPTSTASQADSAKNGKAGQAADVAPADKSIGKLQVWVDKETYVPLKTVVTNRSGQLIEESEATSIQYDVTLPDSLFTYTPPAGAIIFEATDKAGSSR